MAITKDLQDGLHMIAQGKEEGFNILYSHTYNYVYNKAKFIMKNEEDALDLTQETFIHAYRSIGSLEDADNLYAWLGGIVYRQGMKIFRKKRELLVSEDAEGIFENVISEDADSSPEDAVQAKATSEIIMGMIEELPELQRSAILAFYYDNMKIDDIARMFECSSNTIKSRLNYAKKFLKSKVEEHEKQNRYKLCSLSPAIILLAFKSLFTTEGYTLSKETAQTIYNTSCNAVGLTPSALTVSAAVQATSAAGTAATVATKAGLTLGAKIGIGLVSLAMVGTIVTGTILLSESAVTDAPSIQEEVIGEEVMGEAADNADISSPTGTPVLPIDSDHEHTYTEELTKEPSCDESGEMTYTCACGDTYTEETGRMDHCTDRSEITKEATCEEEGVETFYCIFCGREIYTEKLAKLPHTESCNHELAKTETTMDPKDYTYTQYIKLMYVTGTNGLYAWPDENSEPYTYLEIGTAVPVVSKCDQANFYQTPWGMTVSGQNLSEERPVEYAPGGEEGWENFKEESDSKYTYWTGIYRVNGYELHSDYMNKPYVERHMEYAKQGLYTLMYRDVDSDYWSGCYEIMIDKNDYFMSSQYLDWIEAYMKSKGIKVSTAGEEPLLVYRSPKSEDSQKLVVVSICVGK